MTRQDVAIVVIGIALVALAIWAMATPTGDFYFGVVFLAGGVFSVAVMLLPRRRPSVPPTQDRLEGAVNAIGAILAGAGKVWALPRVEWLGFAAIFVSCVLNVYSRYGKSPAETTLSK
jgi:uncharacterized membrane protein HdeD (DUF308 family)